MKGIVFTEFIEMVEQQFGYETVDELLVETNLPSGGAYTAIGTYDHQEIVDLVHALSVKTETSVPKLLNGFGQHLFISFVKIYGQFFEHLTDTFSFLAAVDHHIHVEVKRLYPDAELPNIQIESIGENSMKMIYISERKMGDLAEGLIMASIAHFKENLHFERENLNESGSVVSFFITKK
ncbi:MAG: hypothetical protein GC192_06720 [Bacteroidetes bacterium]|nr:hypothetical protein [Bacteroidota bacterium]